MGYNMRQRGSNFRIKKENFDVALKAIVELADDKNKHQMSGGFWQGGKQTEWHYAWVNMSDLASAKTIKDAIGVWRWEVFSAEPEISREIEEDIVDIYFVGDKIGQENLMFEAIAPFVEDGSYIEMAGEDGAIWRWVFARGECNDCGATVTF
jgi:hypothetical protein